MAVARPQLSDAVAAELGVSVTPVREALLALRGEDMGELKPRRGFMVSPLSRLDVRDIFRLQVRLAARSRELARFLDNASRYTPAKVYTGDPGWRPRNAADHRAILAAPRARDELAAREAVLRHVSDAEQRLLTHLDAIAMW